MTEHKCHKCGSCCRYLEFALENKAINLEFYKVRGVTLHEYDDHIVVCVPHVCGHLRIDNTCDIHETKPEACKQWPQWYEGYPEPCIYGKGD